MKYAFELDDEGLKLIDARFERLRAMTPEERKADLIESGILTPEGKLSPRYKPSEDALPSS